MNKKLSDVAINIRDKIETLQLLEETLEDYVDDMERLVKAEGGGITRVDTWDISFNLSQIHAAVRDSFLPMTRTVNGMPHFSLIEDEEEKEKKKKRERNYNRLERFRSSDIMSLKRRVDRQLEDLQDIYKNYLKPYEKLDDTYRSRLNKIYSFHTSAGDIWANFWDGFASVADSFITAFAIAAVTAFIAAITPVWLAVAGVVLLGVGVAVMANIPEESVPDWLKPVKKGADGIADKAVKMLKEGPASVVEDIGQGLMDEIQTPEGIASVAGGTVGTLAGGYAGSRVNSSLKSKKETNIGRVDEKVNRTKIDSDLKNQNSQLQKVFDIADDYKLSEDVYKNHIIARHSTDGAAFPNKSKFNSDFDIKKGIDRALRSSESIVKPNSAGREGYIFEYTYHSPIGINSKGKPINTIKVVIDKSGNVITAFPKK